VEKDGDDVLIFAIGRSVHEAIAAHDILEGEGISAQVVNCRFVKPLDAELICDLSARVPRIITVEENVLQGGFGSAILECLQENGINGCTVRRIGIDDTFVPHGPQRKLRSEYHIDADAIAEAARSMVGDPKK
jgi:1-deoxy-D-xylulose-5-phosphate synthase